MLSKPQVRGKASGDSQREPASGGRKWIATCMWGFMVIACVALGIGLQEHAAPAVSGSSSTALTAALESPAYEMAGRSVGALVSPNLIRALAISPQLPGVRVDSQELNPVSDYWQSWSLSVPLNFLPECVAARHGDEFLAIGHASTGELIVVRITMPAIPGSFYCQRAASSAPIGTTVTSPPTVVLLRSRPYIPPGDRPTCGPATVVEVYRGPDLGSSHAAIVDPDGRYILLLTNQAGFSLFQVPLVAGGAVRCMTTAAAAPALANAGGFIGYEHGLDGRFYVLDGGAFPGYETVWTWDSNHDGVLDGWDHLAWQGFQAAYPDNVWVAVHGILR